MRMRLSRRAALAGGGTLAAAATGPRLLAQEGVRTAAQESNSGVYRFAIGALRLTALSDGQAAFPAWPAYAPDAEEAAVHAAMRRHGLQPPDYLLDANALLIEAGDLRILVDVGWGPFASTVGGLSRRLRRIGQAPEAIDLVVLSHLHPDHVGGLADAAGAPAFPNAQILVSSEELAQWRGAPDFGAMRVAEDFRPVFLAAAELVFAQGARLTAISGQEEIAPGVRLTPLPGHTRGHVGLRLASEDDALIYAADAFHDPAFDLDHPDWATIFDHDPARAAATRRALLDQAAADQTLLMAYHTPFPGLGRVVKSGERYRWTPMRWRLRP